MALYVERKQGFPWISVGKGISRDLSFMGMSGWEQKHGKVQPTDFAAQLKMFRGAVFDCSRINSSAVADVPWNLYVGKNKRDKKYSFVDTKPVTKAQLEYIHKQNFLQSYRRKSDDVEEITDHPMLDLLIKVNPFMNGYDLFELTVLFLELTGNAYWYLQNGDVGGQSIPQEIWMVQPQWMKPVPDKKKGVARYIYKRGNEEITFEEEEIIHFYCPSPLNEFYGIGSIMGALEAQTVWQDMYQYESAMFKNMGRPDIIWKLKKSLNKDQKAQVEATMRKIHGGTGNVGKPGYFSNEILDEVYELGTKPRDMSYMGGRRWVREEIYAAFRVPISYATMEASNRAVAETGTYQHAKFAVQPYCKRIDQKLTEKLCPRYDEHLFMLHENPVPKDRELRLKETEIWTKLGLITQNEGREYNDFDTVDDGDVFLPQGNVTPMALAGMGEEELTEMAREVMARAKEMWN